jgi:hypothetical protein
MFVSKYDHTAGRDHCNLDWDHHFAGASDPLDTRTIQDIDSTYKVIRTEVHPEHSPMRGLILTPYSLFFY